MKNKSLIFILIPALALSAMAQIAVTWVFEAVQNVPDNGQLADVRVVSNSGLATISDVNVGLIMTGALAMRLGDYFISLTHGTASEEERVAVLLNRPQMTDTSPFGSSLASADITLDDSGTATNVFNITSSTGTYKADGRLSVNPYAEPVPYNSSAVTDGLSKLNGAVISNTWSLLVADTQQGAVGKLVGWTLTTTGTSANSGSVDPGPGGTIADAPGGNAADRNLKSILVISGSGAARVTAHVTESLTLSGGLSGAGELNKTGPGVLTLSGDSSGVGGAPNFTGSVVVSGGGLEIASGMALGLSGSLAFNGPNLSLRLATGDAFARDISLSTGTEIALDGSGTLSGVISGNGGVDKTGAGTVTLSGGNTYLGGSTISAGMLAVEGSLMSSVQVNAGGALKGGGLVQGAVNVSGQLLAGNSVGAVDTGNLFLANGSTFVYDVDFAAAARDFVQVAGNLGIEQGAILALTEQSVNSVPYGSKLTLINYSGSWNGNFFTHGGSTVADGSVVALGSTQWLVRYADNSNSLTITAVPEPSMVILACLSSVGLLMRRRR